MSKTSICKILTLLFTFLKFRNTLGIYVIGLNRNKIQKCVKNILFNVIFIVQLIPFSYCYPKLSLLYILISDVTSKLYPGDLLWHRDLEQMFHYESDFAFA